MQCVINIAIQNVINMTRVICNKHETVVTFDIDDNKKYGMCGFVLNFTGLGYPLISCPSSSSFASFK